MRYLYGDLSEFPTQENTLELLKRFVDMAVEILKLDLEIEGFLEAIESDRQFLVDSIEDIDAFAEAVRETIEAASSGLEKDEIVSVVAAGSDEHLKQYISDAKNRLVKQIEQRIQRTEGDISRCSSRIHDHLKGFFSPSVLPIGGNTLRCTLDGERYLAYSEILDITGSHCSYNIDAAASGFFSEPRKFSDLSPGKIEFPVGTKKAWLKKEPVTETMRIDDALLIEVTDTDDWGEFRLAKRGGNGIEGLVARTKKGRNGGISVSRVDASGAQIPVPEEVLNPSHTEALSEFWRQLYPSVVELYRCRGALSSISIDGTEIVKGRQVGELIGRLVRYLAPTVREIDARSPASEELCLKVEHEGGRREEIYVQKKDLIRKFSELNDSTRAIFAPLGIDTPLGFTSSDEEDTFDEPPTEPGE